MTFFIVAHNFTACSNHPQHDKHNALAGMYKLLSIELRDSTGAWKESTWSKGGESYIIYDGLGHMAVHITPIGYKDFKWLDEEQALNEKRLKDKIDGMSITELKAAVEEFSSSYVYVAKYNISDTANIITHRRLTGSIPSIWGTEVKREFSFLGDTLILKNPTVNRRLTWIRQK